MGDTRFFYSNTFYNPSFRPPVRHPNHSPLENNQPHQLFSNNVAGASSRVSNNVPVPLMNLNVVRPKMLYRSQNPGPALHHPAPLYLNLRSNSKNDAAPSLSPNTANRRQRRGSRGKKKKSPEKSQRKESRESNHPEDVDESVICAMPTLSDQMKIRAIFNPTNAIIYRIKNEGCGHVNLQLEQNYFHSANGHYRITNDPAVRVVGSFSGQIYDDTTPSDGLLPGLFNDITSNLQSANFSSPNNLTKKAKKKKGKKHKVFSEYWSLGEVEKGLKANTVIKGVIRINAKNPNESYVSNEDVAQHDYYIQTLLERNRALEGDVVGIHVKPQNEWTEKLKTAVVVYIFEKVHSRIAVGLLQLAPEPQQGAVFIPRDSRVPNLIISLNLCPENFRQNYSQYANILYRAKLNKWDAVAEAFGVIVEEIGPIGDVDVETTALLVEHNLDVTPFPPTILAQSGIDMHEEIPKTEFDYRKDIRRQCVFTIDPYNARDLDDAVSCDELPNGNLEVGVHISDVSYYLKENTMLDDLVSKKATTIYLVNNVYHMLPRELCMYCSLLPGKDKLAFSVFWEITKEGDIVKSYSCRTIINSCIQLSYEHAQTMIEDPDFIGPIVEFPNVIGNFTYGDLSKRVNQLQKIAVNLRQKRFENGSLRINQTKLLFRLDPQTVLPVDVFVYENKEAHRLIEEFMLLANMHVAKEIRDKFPKLAFLRRHTEPNSTMLKELVKTLQSFSLQLDVSNSKSIQSSLFDIQQKFEGEEGMLAMYHLLAKPMKRAEYFCAADSENPEDFHHYALSVPLYTHFTSPIRRYADIMVHRLMSAALGHSENPSWSHSYVNTIANICNTQKYNAKLAGEASSDLFLSQYVAANQPFIKTAIVVDIKNSFFDILVVETGTTIRLHPNNLIGNVACEEVPNNSSTKKKYLLIFPSTREHPKLVFNLELFTILQVSLHPKPKSNKLDAELLCPEPK